MQQRSPHFLTLDQISRLMFRFSLHYFASERFRSTFQFYLVTRLVNSILSKKSAVYQFLNKVTSKRYRFDLSYPKLKLLLFSELSTRKEGGPWITRVICALYTMLSLARRTFGLPERSKRQATLHLANVFTFSEFPRVNIDQYSQASKLFWRKVINISFRHHGSSSCPKNSPFFSCKQPLHEKYHSWHGNPFFGKLFATKIGKTNTNANVS